MLTLIACMPSNVGLMKTVFLWANGIPVVSIALFGNKLIFHELDSFVSLSIHLVPMLVTMRMKWVVMPLKPELAVILDQDNTVLEMLIFPLIGYSIWAILWFIALTFVFADHIRENKLETTPFSFMSPNSSIGQIVRKRIPTEQ
jgi:hypothetical protein